MTIDKSWTLPFACDRVYSTWVSSETVIAPATAMDIDPVIGGHYRLIMETPAGNWIGHGTFREIDPGRHLRYSWQWNDDDEVSEITVTFEPAEKGTALRIVHAGFASEESRENHRRGWDSYVEGLKAHMAARLADPG